MVKIGTFQKSFALQLILYVSNFSRGQILILLYADFPLLIQFYPLICRFSMPNSVLSGNKWTKKYQILAEEKFCKLKFFTHFKQKEINYIWRQGNSVEEDDWTSSSLAVPSPSPPSPPAPPAGPTQETEEEWTKRTYSMFAEEKAAPNQRKAF